jgi:hypothetical protein
MPILDGYFCFMYKAIVNTRSIEIIESKEGHLVNE